MTTKLSGFMLLSAIATTAYAASVPHTFQAGQPARAAEVNANFAALVTAVTALENRVTALENPPAPTVASVAGTYKYDSLGVGLKEGTSENATVSGEKFAGTITLNANGTFTGSLSGDETNARVNSVVAGTNHFHSISGGPPNSTNSAALPGPVTNTQLFVTRDSDTESPAGTWSIVGGEVVVNSNGGEVIKFLPASSKLLIGVSREASAPGDIEDFYIVNILVKQ